MQGTRDPVMTSTGAEIVQQLSFIWELENVDIILKSTSMINAQKIDFHSKAGSGQQSKWSLYLEAPKGTDSFRFRYALKETTTPTGTILLGDDNDLYPQMFLKVKDQQGIIIWESESEPLDQGANNGIWRFSKVFTIEEHLEAAGQKRWNIHVTFNLYSPKKQGHDQIGGLGTTLEQFQAIATLKARKDLGTLIMNPVGGDVKIIAGDGVEFSVPKGILTTRSPYFEAMLRADMAESKDGLIRLPTVTGKSLEILLHFLMTGELLPGWKEAGIIVELTNAAAEYQLPDLLQFLNMSLGKVCELGNVVQLFTLANKLGLERAEKELLKFISVNGAGCSQNFFQIMKTISGMDANHI